MFFDRKEDQEDRLKNVLISDKQFSPEKIKKVLKSDVFYLLTNYCDLEPENLTCEVFVQEDGSYKFNIQAISDRLKIFGTLPEIY